MIERLKQDKGMFEQALRGMAERARSLEAELAALMRDINVNQGALAYIEQLLAEQPQAQSADGPQALEVVDDAGEGVGVGQVDV